MFLIRAIFGFILFLSLATILISGGFLFSISPKHLQSAVDVEIARGSSLNSAAQTLKDAGVIRSALAFQSLVLMEGGERDIVAGTYRFSEPEGSRRVAERLIRGEFNSDSLAITFPEGTTVKEMSHILARRFNDLDVEKFLELASPLEGFLFPDTYFFHNDVTPEEVIKRMQDTFSSRVSDISISDRLRGRTFEEIVNMASILEEEARDLESRQIISGILWKRLEDNFPLQVDAAFLYIDELEGRNTYDLTKDDLAVDSPYNTYVNTGLPPTPITNPGLESMIAAANPIDSDYMFYLSDTKGNMYYAETFDDHVANRVFLDY